MADRYWVGGSGSWSSTAKWSTSSGGSGGASVPTAADSVFFTASSDSGAAITVTLTGASTCLDLNMSAIDQDLSFTGAFTLSVLGNLQLSGTKTISVTGITSFSMTATVSRAITSNGGTLTGGITFAGVGGSWLLQDALTVTGTVTHTNGTLTLNSYTLTAPAYNNTGTAARALSFSPVNSTSKFAINATTTSTVWSIASATGLTITNPSHGTVDIIGSSNITRTIATLALAEASAMNFNILATAGTTTTTASNSFRNLVVNCPGATFSNITTTVYGNLSYLGGTWAAGANLMTLAPSSGSFTITGTGGAFDFPITYNSSPTGAGAYTLASNVTIGATASRTFTHQQGTLNLSSYTLTVYGIYNTSGTATRTLNFGTGYIDLTLNGSTATTIWESTTVTALTITNAATGAIRIKGSGTLARTINTGGLSEANSLSFEYLSTAGSITQNATTGNIQNLTVNCPGTTVLNTAASIYGNFSYVAGTMAAGASTVQFRKTVSGTQTLSMGAGLFLNFPVTFAGTQTYSLSSDFSIGVIASATARTVSFTTGTLELNSYALTIYGPFNPTGTGTRRIQMSGSGGKIVLTLDTASTVYNNGTVTNFTTDGNVLIQLTGGGAVQKTIQAGAGTEAQAISFQLSTTAGTVAFTASNTIKNLTIDNNTFTLSNIAITIYGNLLISGTSPTLTAGTSAWTFAATSSKTITTSGETLDFPLTFNGAGGTWALQDALTVGTATSRTVTLTAGTLELNSYTFTIFGNFLSSNSNTRRIQMSGSGGKIVISLNTATTVIDTSTITNLTTDGNVLVQLTGGGAVSKRIDSGLLSEANAISFQISCTAGTATFTASNTIKNLTLDNTSYTLSNVAVTIYGNLTINGTTPTLTAGTNAWTFAATSGTKTITTSGETLDFPVTFNGVGGTWALQDALTMGSTRVLTLTAGTFNLNNLTCTAAGGFASNGTSAKVLAHGTGDLVVSTSGPTAFNASGTRTIADASGSSVTITNNGGVAYNPATPFGGGTGGSILFNGSSQNLSIASNANLALGTGDFTLEFWIYLNSNNSTLFDQRNGTNGVTVVQPAISVSAANGYVWYVTAGNRITSGATAVAIGRWQHVAVVRSSGISRMYIDGTQVGANYTDGQNYPAGSITIGRANDGVNTSFLNGYITNFRIVKGTAVYTSNFTPPAVLEAITGTQLLLKVASSAALVTDSSPNAITVTNTGTATYNSLIPYSEGETSGSLSFDGTTQYLSAPSSTAFDQNGSFTMECWCYRTSASSNGYLFIQERANYMGVYFHSTLRFIVDQSGVGTVMTSTNTFAINTWYHVALTYDGTTHRLFVNGALEASATGRATATSGAILTIGSYTNSTGRNFPGYITNFRFVKGTALYTNTFTPPTSPLTAVSGTSLLIKQNDDSTGTLTSTGTGKISMTSASAKTFVGNGNSYNTLSQDGAGALTITGNNTFVNLTNTVQPSIVSIMGLSTQTFTSNFQLAGTSGNLVTLRSTVGTSQFNVSLATGTVNIYYCSISDGDAIGGAIWYALVSNGNVNGGNNTGFIFTETGGNFLIFFI